MHKWISTDYSYLVHEASILASEEGENPEYDRALAELIASVYAVAGMPVDERASEVAADIRAHQRIHGIETGYIYEEGNVLV